MNEVLKQALDALETELSIDWANNDEFNASAEKMYKAIAAIKEALAQPEQWGASAVTHPEYVAEQKRKTEELRSRLAQPEQEPVKDWVASHNAICALLRQAHDALALTSYPMMHRWVGLTDEERSYYLQSASNVGWWQAAQFIEAKLKEKNCL